MNVPPPNSFDSYDYGSTARLGYQGGGNDPYGSYGSYGDPNAAYKQQILQYISQTKMALSMLQAGSPEYNQAVSYLNTAYQYLQEVGGDPSMSMSGGWDPMSGGYGMGGYGDPSQGGMGVDGNATGPSFPVSYQDSAHIVSEDGKEVTVTADRNNPDTRVVDFYQPNGTAIIPSNAVKTTVTQSTDENGDPMVVIKGSWPNGGSFEWHFHKPKHISIQAANPDNVTKDASLGDFASKVTVGELGETTQTEPKGDQPTNGSDEWDGDSFEIHSTSGTDDNHVMARGNVDFVADSNKEYWTVEWDDSSKQYVVKIYDDASCTEDHLQKTFHVDKMSNTKLSFNIDQTHIKFLGSLADPSDPDGHTINTSDENGKNLAFGGEGVPGNGAPINSDYPEDSVPSKVDGKDAYYDQDENVSLHNDPNSTVTTYHITAGGTVDIFGTSQADSAYIDFIDGQVRVMLTTPDGKMKWFMMDAKMMDKLNIHLDSSKIHFDETNLPVPADIRSKITNGDGQSVDTVSDKSQLPETIQNLLGKISGADLDKVMASLLQYFPEIDSNGDGSISAAELKTAADNKVFPPAKPSEKLINFMLDIDPQLKADLEACNTKSDTGYASNMRTTMNRLSDLLNQVYPKHDIHPMKKPSDAQDPDYLFANNMMFDGEIWEPFAEGADQRGQVQFNWYGPYQDNTYTASVAGIPVPAPYGWNGEVP